MNDKTNIEKLIKKAQAGDTDAFAYVYDEYFSHIYRYVYYRVNKEEVDDVVAQVFMKAWDNLGRFKIQKGVSFGAWLFRIAHNLVVDQYRVHRGVSELPTELIDERRESDPRHVAQIKLDQVVLKRALSQVKDVYKQVILLKFINGLSNQEIAEVLKRKEGNVRILQFRALKELKVVLAKMGYSS